MLIIQAPTLSGFSGILQGALSGLGSARFGVVAGVVGFTECCNPLTAAVIRRQACGDVAIPYGGVAAWTATVKVGWAILR